MPLHSLMHFFAISILLYYGDLFGVFTILHGSAMQCDAHTHKKRGERNNTIIDDGFKHFSHFLVPFFVLFESLMLFEEFSVFRIKFNFFCVHGCATIISIIKIKEDKRMPKRNRMNALCKWSVVSTISMPVMSTSCHEKKKEK